MVAWVERLRDLPGNPAGVTVERFGGAVALACETLPDLDFVNSVHGLDPAERGQVDERDGVLPRRSDCAGGPRSPRSPEPTP